MTAEQANKFQRDAVRAACERANVKLIEALDHLRPVEPFVKLIAHIVSTIDTNARLCRELAHLIEQEQSEDIPRLPLG